MIIVFIGIIFVIILLHLYYIDGYKYWEKRGHICYRKYHPYIDILRVFSTKSVIFDDIRDMYNGIPDKQVYGMCPFKIPQLLVKDPEILRNVFVKDFDHFANHLDVFFKNDPLFGKSLFVLKDQKWRDMRTILSPVFTGSKLRGLYQLISECAEQTMEYCAKKVKEENVNQVLKIDLMDVCTRFTNDAIATTAFGVKVNSLINPNNEFFNAGREITKFPVWRAVLIVFFPTISKILKLRFAPKYIYDFFRKIVTETIKVREDQNIVRPDMIHLLMEARKDQKKIIKEMSSSNENVTVLSNNLLTNEDITAQGLVFFSAGYGNIAITICFAAYELAVQPEIQKRVQNEISETLKENDGRLDYDILKKMKYLEMVVSETLRKWPPAAVIDRECNKTYEIVSNNEVFDVSPGTTITIPVVGFHYDPKFFPNPNKFDPERFNDENREKMNPYTYLPFGAGPRVCIAVRFVLMETKIFLIQLLSQFDVVVTENTPIPMVLAPGNVIKPKIDFNLALKLRT